MIRTIYLTLWLLAFKLWIRRWGLDWRRLRRKLLRLLGVLCRFFWLLGVSSGWRQVRKLGEWFLLSPGLNRSLSNVLFVSMLRIYLLSLSLNLLLVLLLVQGLMVELSRGWVRILICVRLDRRRNFLVENSGENILVLLLLRDCLWDIGAQVVLLIEVGRVILIFRQIEHAVSILWRCLLAGNCGGMTNCALSGGSTPLILHPLVYHFDAVLRLGEAFVFFKECLV